MITFVQLYVVSICVFALCDLLWLGVIARNFYQSRLGHLLGDVVVWPAAIVFYIVFLFGLTYFVTYAHFNDGVRTILVQGFLFGLVTYGAYDLTNHATLREWPLAVTLIDMLWGACLGMIVAVVSYLTVHALK